MSSLSGILAVEEFLECEWSFGPGVSMRSRSGNLKDSPWKLWNVWEHMGFRATVSVSEHVSVGDFQVESGNQGKGTKQSWNPRSGPGSTCG